MRLIDADELREAIEGHDCLASTRGIDTEAKAKMEFKKQVLQDIEEQPTIEALEKRDEPKMVEVDRRMDSGMHLAHCPNCWKFINNIHHNKYCGYCGQAVKWE